MMVFYFYVSTVRCRLKHNGKILHSQWSNPIQFTTTSSEFIAVTSTDDQNVGKALDKVPAMGSIFVG